MVDFDLTLLAKSADPTLHFFDKGFLGGALRMWMELSFGKHVGKTLPQILLSDPDWFFWAVSQEDFFKGRLLTEARELFRRSTNVKVPRNQPAGYVVEYFIGTDGKFAHFGFVEPDRARHVGSSSTERSDRLDFSIVRKYHGYDKSGYKLFLKNFKHYYLGSETARITKRVAEDFFSKTSNFH